MAIAAAARPAQRLRSWQTGPSDLLCSRLRIALSKATHRVVCSVCTGRAFEGWQEGPLSFPPTFKFVRGTTQYHGDGPGPDPASPRTAGGTEPNGDAVRSQNPSSTL